MKIKSINIAPEKGSCKKPVESGFLKPGGVEGDSHFGNGIMEVSFLDDESVQEFTASSGRQFNPGDFAENITFTGNPDGGVHLLDTIRIGEAFLEVTQLGKTCHNKGCEIFTTIGTCIMPKKGFFCRVKTPGAIKPGDEMIYERRKLKAGVITLSDRAFNGVYPDLSGPLAGKMLTEFFTEKQWDVDVKYTLIPDEKTALEDTLKTHCRNGVNLIITAGSTGAGPRDIAPEVVADFCHKILPGVMDYVRITYGAKNPNALLSRSIAGVHGEVPVYAIPGSTKAVNEYMTEILKSAEHLLLTTRGLMLH
ncbi:MAG: molybdenum cofactor synthesis protein [Firmicutes bacterium]|nr:molybdenum cofactor synthesis protein [Bacillota bacterium]